MYFDEFDFEDEVLDALDAMRFEKCTPIQEQTLQPLHGYQTSYRCDSGGESSATALLGVFKQKCGANADRSYSEDQEWQVFGIFSYRRVDVLG